MDSRESLASQPSLQQHHAHHQQQQQPPPGMNMMMPPNSFSTHHHLSNNSNAAAANNNKNANMMSPNSMQQRFPFNPSNQFGDGSSPSGGFRTDGYSIEPARKKRGRPRKYSPSPDGNIALGLAPAPVAAVPPSGGGNLDSSNDGSGGTPNADSSAKKNRGRPAGSGKKQLDALGAPGVGFTPHVIIVKAGEDIASTIMAFSQQGPRTVCVLSANGAIGNVTLRQPATSGGTVTYEGRFEIISLSGSFLHSESNGNHSKPSGLSVSLAGSDGRVLGGGVAGMLVAASPVQVIVGSFIADAKKPKSSSGPSPAAPPNMLTFGGGGGGAAPGISPPSEGPSSESSDESGSSPLQRIPGSYNNSSHHHHHQQQQQHHQQPPQQQHHQQPPQQQQQQQQPMQNLPMYTNMGWPSSTMNMLPN
ncbi:hypothetical protein L2E82_40288 [Cichorium intybus]|uniref:Uncharacterized protein n=1 Tax=Cichorium intybus TaxID=13427 RepID=A0ACB9ALJ2_CICIN|nr:hypothetical protein L2E82_40288 [Cichorium intybus]